LADRVIGVAVLLEAKLSLAASSALTVHADCVTSRDIRASLGTASLILCRAGRSGSVEVIVASERASARNADTPGVCNIGRALAVERAAISLDLTSAACAIKDGVAQALVTASSISSA